jgi:Raf kinase inhibitor-like YbhB/YbcL family protein
MPQACRSKFVRNFVLLLGCFLVIGACSTRPTEKETAPATLDLTSTDFAAGATIPKPFTCDGGDLSPALAWNAPPTATQSFALIADDPDAPVGTWVHWVIFDMPATLRSLPQNFPKDEQSADGTRQGKNDFDKIGYGGPCPPPGKVHRYFFKLYALDTKLNLSSGSTKKDLERAMQGHILARGEYMGRYSH